MKITKLLEIVMALSFLIAGCGPVVPIIGTEPIAATATMDVPCMPGQEKDSEGLCFYPGPTPLPLLAAGQLGEIRGLTTVFEVKLGNNLGLDFDVVPYYGNPGFFDVGHVLCHYPDGSEVILTQDRKIVGLNKIGQCTGTFRVTFYTEDGKSKEDVSTPITINVVAGKSNS